MSYSDGNTPAMGDKVKRQKDGKVGTVTHVQLNYPTTPGHDNIGFKPDDGSIGVGNSLAVEHILISRTKSNVDEEGHDLAWHKEHCKNCIELAPGHWQWCEKARPLFVKEP